MIEIVWQYDPHNPPANVLPATGVEAQRLLESGNLAFARFMAGESTAAAGTGTVARHVTVIGPQDLGVSLIPGAAPTQEPFAAFLSCADARVPLELIFNQATNDIFVVRVAGNVLGAECLGSLDFAVKQLGSVRLLGVLGHTSCGAVSAAADAFLHPATYLAAAANLPLRSIVDGLMATVNSAAAVLEDVHGRDVYDRPGFRAALIETSVVLNAALTAGILEHSYAGEDGAVAIAFGVYNLVTRQVGLPGGTVEWEPGLYAPPGGHEGFVELGGRIAGGPYISRLLG